MITIFSCTNRPNSNTLKIAKHYSQLLEKQGITHKLFSFEHLPHDIAFAELFNNRSTTFQQILDEYVIPSNTFIFISPEYNGSYPGILKLFLDAIHPDINRGKKAGLVGVAMGRAGNIRGMEHLTGVLNYLGMFVHTNKLPISAVTSLLDAEGRVKDENTNKVLEKHVKDLIAF